MSEYPVRRFANEAAIARLGEGLLACRLAREDWTHEAHLGATCWLATMRPDIDLKHALPDIIRAFNVSVGGINDDGQGYHETITQVFLRGVRLHLAETGPAQSDRAGPLVDRVNALLVGERGRRDWPLRFYSKARLFSVAARRSFLAPDLEPIR